MDKSIRIIVIFLYLLLMSYPLLAQWDRWTDPQTLTDPSADNRNAVIQLLQFIEHDYYMFWEKSTDSLSTSIYYQKFYGDSDAEIFKSDEGIHYSSPQLMDTKYHIGDDTLFGVFYLSDESGINQIYYQVYNQPEGFTAPQMLTASGQEQSNLSCNNEGKIVWIEQKKIMVSILDKSTFLFSEPQVLDSGNCTFPSLINSNPWWKRFDNPEVAWIKEENDSASVWIINYDNQNGWLEPQKHFSAKHCAHLSFCQGFGSPYILSWDFKNASSWQFVHYDIESGGLHISVLSQQQPFQPVYYSGFLFVKARDLDVGFASVKYSNSDTVNIFTTRDFFWWNGGLDQYQNVSTTSNELEHPQLFTGKFEGPCNYYFINIWEERMNNRWQLRYAETYECLSDIEEEKESDALVLNISPNPFKEELTIDFKLDKPNEVILSVYNPAGLLLETLESNKLGAGTHRYKWNGKVHKAGLYFVSLQRNSQRVTKKIVLTK